MLMEEIWSNKKDAARKDVVLSCCLAVGVGRCVVDVGVVVVCGCVEEKKVVTSVSNVVKDAKKIDCSVRRDHMRRHAIAQRDQAAVEARGAH